MRYLNSYWTFIGLVALSLCACGDQDFFAQDEAQTVSRPTPKVDRGVYSIQVPANANFSYEVTTSVNSDLEGAKVTLLPSALNLESTIQVTKGDDLLSPLMMHELGWKGDHQNLVHGVAVWVGSNHPEALQKDMKIDLPIPVGDHVGDLAVLYHKGTPETGYDFGLYTARNKLIDSKEGYASLTVSSFGSYQVVIVSSIQKNAATLGEVSTTRPVLNIDDAIALPTLAWEVSLEAQTGVGERGVQAAFTLSGGTPQQCYGFVYASTQGEWERVIESLDQQAIIWTPEDSDAHVRYLLIECLLEDGRQVYTGTLSPYSFQATDISFTDLQTNYEDDITNLSLSSTGTKDYRYQVFPDERDCTEPLGSWLSSSTLRLDFTNVKSQVTLCIQGRDAHGHIQGVQSFQWHQGILGALWTDDLIDLQVSAGQDLSYLVRASDPESSTSPTFDWDPEQSSCDDSLFTVSIDSLTGRLTGVAKTTATGTCTIMVLTRSLGHTRQRQYAVVVQ